MKRLIALGVALFLFGGYVASVPGPTADAAAPKIGRSGTRLILNGQPTQFTGVNSYSLATLWGTNSGCGGMFSDAELDSFFASLRPNSLVRMWAFQGSMAFNPSTGQIDWRPLDRVFAAAARHGQRLIPVLTNHWDACDGGGGNKDAAWYQGGYRYVRNSSGLTPLSFWSYLRRIVPRYRSSPALGMWELVNEPEAPQQGTCDEGVARAALRYFFDRVGGELKRLDPGHLSEAGLMGNGQCGAQGGDYEYVIRSPGVDVASFHDYGSTAPMPGDDWNGLQTRLNQANAANKPLVVGEVGQTASVDGAGCLTLVQRRDVYRAKMDAQFNGSPAGISAFLPWNFGLSAQGCTYELIPGDPALDLLHDYPLLNN